MAHRTIPLRPPRNEFPERRLGRLRSRWELRGQSELVEIADHRGWESRFNQPNESDEGHVSRPRWLHHYRPQRIQAADLWKRHRRDRSQTCLWPGPFGVLRAPAVSITSLPHHHSGAGSRLSIRRCLFPLSLRVCQRDARRDNPLRVFVRRVGRTLREHDFHSRVRRQLGCHLHDRRFLADLSIGIHQQNSRL